MLTKNVKIFNKEFIERFDLHLHKVFVKELKSNKSNLIYLVKRLDNFLHKTFDLPKQDEHDYSKDYLTTIALEDGIIIFSINQSMNTDMITSISYSINDGEWVTVDNQDDKEDNLLIEVSISKGDKVRWKGNAVTTGDFGNDVVSGFLHETNIDVQGNVMSLLYGDNFLGQTTFPSEISNFYYLFGNDLKGSDLISCNVVTANNLILPATTLVEGCYVGMFAGCTSLTAAPELPATTLADFCYNEMFFCCNSLTEAPELPATTLANSCYTAMFDNCTSLTTAPELPATTLAPGCYEDMFRGCTSLTTAHELPATTLASSCYRDMFASCTSLETAPELPATTLAGSCYNYMFSGCTSLNYIKCLATDISSQGTNGWLENVAVDGTFVKDASMTSWTIGPNGIPENWEVEDAEI